LGVSMEVAVDQAGTPQAHHAPTARSEQDPLTPGRPLPGRPAGVLPAKALALGQAHAEASRGEQPRTESAVEPHEGSNVVSASMSESTHTDTGEVPPVFGRVERATPALTSPVEAQSGDGAAAPVTEPQRAPVQRRLDSIAVRRMSESVSGELTPVLGIDSAASVRSPTAATAGAESTDEPPALAVHSIVPSDESLVAGGDEVSGATGEVPTLSMLTSLAHPSTDREAPLHGRRERLAPRSSVVSGAPPAAPEHAETGDSSAERARPTPDGDTPRPSATAATGQDAGLSSLPSAATPLLAGPSRTPRSALAGTREQGVERVLDVLAGPRGAESGRGESRRSTGERGQPTRDVEGALSQPSGMVESASLRTVRVRRSKICAMLSSSR
jgi:hypothetical protein